MSNFDDKLAQHISEISKEKQPERDLWRGIELGITSQQGDASQDDASSSTVTSKQWMAIDAMSMQQQQQVNSLLASYESTTALTEDWQEQLKELDDAADVIKAALKDDPDNSALIKMLHHVYQQQIALIERVHAPKWQQI